MDTAAIARERLQWCVWNDRTAAIRARQRVSSVDKLLTLRREFCRNSRHAPTDAIVPQSAVGYIVSELAAMMSVKRDTHYQSPLQIERELRAGLVYVAGMKLHVGDHFGVSLRPND